MFHLVIAAVLGLIGLLGLLDVDGISKVVVCWTAIIAAVLIVLVPYFRGRVRP